jgi:hypothetical protein
LPNAVKEAFEAESKQTVSTVTERVTAKGPVLCRITVNSKTVVDTLITIEMQQNSIFGLPTLEVLGCNLTVVGYKPAYSSGVTAAQPDKYKVQLLKDEVIPSNSQKSCAFSTISRSAY